MRTTMQIKYKPSAITFGNQSKGIGNVERTFYNQKRTDDLRLQGKHPACKNCLGCGKGMQCPVL